MVKYEERERERGRGGGGGGGGGDLIIHPSVPNAASVYHETLDNCQNSMPDT